MPLRWANASIGRPCGPGWGGPGIWKCWGMGAAWIWNLKDQRWQRAVEVLDFYHGSEHVWALGRASCRGKKKAKDWTEPLLHQIRHYGQEKRRCGKLPDCKGPKENQQKWCGGSRTTSARRSGTSDELCADRGTRLAHWFRSSRISLSSTPVSIQKAWAILDQAGVAQSLRSARSQPQPSLARTLGMMKSVAVSRCAPCPLPVPPETAWPKR